MVVVGNQGEIFKRELLPSKHVFGGIITDGGWITPSRRTSSDPFQTEPMSVRPHSGRGDDIMPVVLLVCLFITFVFCL